MYVRPNGPTMSNPKDCKDRSFGNSGIHKTLYVFGCFITLVVALILQQLLWEAHMYVRPKGRTMSNPND